VNSIEHEFEIHRIVVAIDCTAHAAAALEAAATLAATLHAELEGVFVQDINLAHLAELPVGREIQFLTGRASDFTASSHAEQNKEQELSARRAIAAAATRAQVTHQFRVARGQVDVEVISAAGNADLLILGVGSRSPGGRDRLGNTARAAAERAPHSVLISKPGTRSIAAPLVCYDGSDGAKRALKAAVRLSSAGEKGLTVLIIAQDVHHAGELRQEVDNMLETMPARTKFLHSAQPAPDQICRFATESGADILIMSADCSLIAGAERLSVLERIACPVLLVR
jgi:nucleotide-binding universal stress UspA family protein